MDHVTVYIRKPSLLVRTQVCLCQRWKCKMWCGPSSRNQWKRKDELHPQKKWKRKCQTFPSNPNPRNKYPQKRTASQKSPGLCCSHAIGLHHSDLAYFIIFLFFYFIALSSLELPYVTPLENKQRKSFTSKALYPLANIPKARPVQKQRRE